MFYDAAYLSRQLIARIIEPLAVLELCGQFYAYNKYATLSLQTLVLWDFSVQQALIARPDFGKHGVGSKSEGLPIYYILRITARLPRRGKLPGTGAPATRRVEEKRIKIKPLN